MTIASRQRRRRGGSVRAPGRAPAPGEPLGHREAKPEKVAAPGPDTGIRRKAELSTAALRAKASFIQLCRNDVNVFAEYILQDKEGAEVRQAPIHVKMHAALDRFGQAIVMAFPGCGKAIPIDTEIPTPSGFVRMRDLEEGSEVFDRRGVPCRVTFATPVQYDRVLYEIELSDGAVVKADADHRWLAYSLTDLRFGREPRVVTTQGMIDAGPIKRTDGRYRWKIPVAEAVHYPTRELPIHPYVLGVWLGDGLSAGPTISYHEDDAEVVERCAFLEGGWAGPPRRDGARTWLRTIGGDASSKRDPRRLKKRLRDLGVLGEKHVPERYLTASVEQREELLAGLLDTDGTVSRGTSRVEYTSVSERLATGVLELARSLGFKASIHEGDAVLDGERIGPKWRVTFTARRPVFRLRRKLALLDLEGDDRRQAHRSVVAIRRVESEPVRCISVDSPDSSYLMGRSYTVTHNTSQIAVARNLWKLGKNPRRRILLLNEVQKGGSDKTLGVIKRYIEGKVLDESGVSRLHEVFPELTPGDKWTETAIRVNGAGGSARDWSVQAIGYMGAILGSRLSDVVIDDLLTHGTTRTKSKRDELKRWLENSVWTRLDDGAEVAFLTNAWHRKDAAHTLGWPVLKFPVYDAAGNPSWPEEWPRDRIERTRRRLKISALEFARAWLCQPKDPGEQVFTDTALERTKRNGLEYRLVESLPEGVPPGCFIVHGVDLGASKKREGARTAIASVLFHPNADRQLLRFRAGRWGAIRILQEIVDVGKSFPGSIAMVENNGVQQWMVDLARENRTLLGEDGALIPVYPYRTGTQKADPTLGVESLAGEMEAGGWIFPCDEVETMTGIELRAPEAVADVLEALESYVATEHTPDPLMALWFATEGGRRLLARRQAREEAGSGVVVIG